MARSRYFDTAHIPTEASLKRLDGLQELAGRHGLKGDPATIDMELTGIALLYLSEKGAASQHTTSEQKRGLTKARKKAEELADLLGEFGTGELHALTVGRYRDLGEDASYLTRLIDDLDQLHGDADRALKWLPPAKPGPQSVNVSGFIRKLADMFEAHTGAKATTHQYGPFYDFVEDFLSKIDPDRASRLAHGTALLGQVKRALRGR